eukprot:Gb_30592 [translate_table: standard]
MGKSTKKDFSDAKNQDTAENRERQRLRKLAFTSKILSQTRANPRNPLQPSKIILKSHGKDIVKKGQRKSKYLFAFPCLVAPVSGGKMGELAQLDTKNPVLYVDFPQGRMKFFGTIIYPKNKYLALHFMRGSGNVVCEDSFDSTVVFSDVWWIGKKEENPEELKLEFPKELSQEKHEEFDFKGGAGGVSDHKSIAGVKLPLKEHDEKASPETPFKFFRNSEHLTSNDSKCDVEGLEEEPKVTPVRSSARTAGKTFKFADSPSEDDLASTGNDSSSSDPEQLHKTKKQKVNRNLSNMLGEATAEGSAPVLLDTEHDTMNIGLDKVHTASTPAQKTSSSRKRSRESASAVATGVLVQSSISSFLEKPEEKKPKKSLKTPSETKAQRRRSIDHKGKSNKIKDAEEEKSSEEDVVEAVQAEHRQPGRRRSGRESASKGKQAKSQINHESSEIEKASDGTEVSDDSDEDWTG